MLLLRFFLPAIIMLSLILLVKRCLPERDMWRVLIIRAVGVAACQFCFLYSLGKLSLVESVVLFSTGPIFIALFERCLFKIQLQSATLWAIGLTFWGVIFLAGNTDGFTFKPELLIGLMSGMFNAVSQLSLHRASKSSMSGMESSGWSFLLAGVILVPILALFHEQGAVDLNFTFTASHIVMLIVMVMTFAIIGTQLARNSAYRLAETNSQLAPLIYTNLVFTAVWQFTLFDERFSLHQYIGLGLIVGANMLRSGLLKQMAKQMLKRFR
ncbi:metabolite transporter superfamily [Vibrio ishigakensis]|uniref:Metabolite transporter superfamily n=1 Tax=Vibrio ishigakensis TaxID=1481914 RepID=A0A0B8PCD6_9VIBR|nr:metabolite transporter superfamily [Vibrio ishigakensis]